MKTVKERKRELAKMIKEKNQRPNSSAKVIYQDNDVVIVEIKIIRTDQNGNETYITYQYTSSVHWTDIVEVTRQQKWEDQYDVDIRYSSGGTIAANPALIAKAMELIFRFAGQRAEELTNDSGNDPNRQQSKT